MLLKNLRVEVLEHSRQMIADGLAYGSGGNLSARDPDSGLIAITPTAINYLKMRPEDVVVVDEDGAVQDGAWRPTSELPLHMVFYRHRPDVHAVVHTHALHASAFAVTGQSIPMVVVEGAICLGGDIPCAPYQRPGTQALAREALEVMGAGVAVLLGNHGLLTVGPTLSAAYASTIAAEVSARLTILARTMGVEPMQLDSAEVGAMRAAYRQHYHPQRSDD